MSIMPRKAYQIVALVLICLAVGTVIVCQVHPTSRNHEHAVPSKHHPAPASHAGVDLFCVVAVLPALAAFFVGLFLTLYATPQLLKPTALVLLLFIPPRNNRVLAA